MPGFCHYLRVLFRYFNCNYFLITLLYIIMLSQINYNINYRRGNGMEKFRVNTNDGKISSINRTIRLKPEYFEKIMELSEKTGVSFNKIVNQCIEYALNNMEEK